MKWNLKLLCKLLQEPLYIANEIDGSATNYTISYSDSIFGTKCGLFNIPASDYEDEVCTHTFNILTLSFCPLTTAVTMKVLPLMHLEEVHHQMDWSQVN